MEPERTHGYNGVSKQCPEIPHDGLGVLSEYSGVPYTVVLPVVGYGTLCMIYNIVFCVCSGGVDGVDMFSGTKGDEH